MRQTHAQRIRGMEVQNRTYGGEQIIESNRITEKYNNLFIHIPKTGGISIKDCMIGYSMFSDHYFAVDVIDKLGDENVFLYTFLRNPYSRIVSIYEAVYRATAGHVVFVPIGESEPQQAQPIPDGYIIHPDKAYHYRNTTKPAGLNFGAGWGDTLDYQPLNEYFRSMIHGGRMQAAAVLENMGDIKTANLIKGVIRENLSFEKFVDIIINEAWHVWWEPQTSFILDDDDKLVVDYVGNTASLQEDLHEIVDLIEERCGEKLTVNPVRQTNETEKSRPNLKAYYKDADTKKKVEKYYERDFDYMKASGRKIVLS